MNEPMPCSVFRRSHETMVWVCGRDGPTKPEWETYTDAVVTLAHQLGARSKSVGVLVVTDGGAPDSTQRVHFVKATRGIGVRAAVVSVSMLVRSAITVFNWFDVNNKAFAPQDIIAALDFLGVEASQRLGIVETVEDLSTQVRRGMLTTALIKEVFEVGIISKIR